MIAYKRFQAGFAAFEVLVVFIVVAVIGALGYTFYGRMDERTATDSEQSRIASDVQEAPEITRASDLDKAATIVDQTDPEASSGDLDDLEKMMSEF